MGTLTKASYVSTVSVKCFFKFRQCKRKHGALFLGHSLYSVCVEKGRQHDMNECPAVVVC